MVSVAVMVIAAGVFVLMTFVFSRIGDIVLIGLLFWEEVHPKTKRVRSNVIMLPTSTLVFIKTPLFFRNYSILPAMSIL